MKIGIDVRMWSESGIGRYIRNIVKELKLLDQSNQFVLFGLESDRAEIEKIIKGVNSQFRFVPVSVRWYSFSEQLFLPYFFYKERLDVVHFPHFNIPLLYFKPFVVTIHDLTHFTFSMRKATTLHPVFYAFKHAIYSLVFQQAVFRSRKIICVSQYVKNELTKRFPQTDLKIEVIYESYDNSLLPLKGDNHLKISVPDTFFFYVGNAHPHKNIEFLLRAFQRFRSVSPDYFLILSGKNNFFWQEVEKYGQINNLNQNVIYTGYVDDSSLAMLYSKATAFIFPSLSEGFGLPLLEAMQMKCPILSARSTCLPEIAGDSALFFDPYSEQNLVDLMQLCATDSALREELIRKGTQRVTEFSWKTAALETYQVYINLK